MLPEALTHTWPWYIAGPLIGLFVPLLQLVGDKQLGISGNLRHLCSALLPRRNDFLRYDWRGAGAWNLLFALGTLAGGWIGVSLLGTREIAISPETQAALRGLGLQDLSGLAPREVISWSGLLSLRGFVSVVVGGFLVGFGTAYAGGCTSGHAINGLSGFQLRSLWAVLGFFAGGLLATHLLLPLLY
jgi:uncharacterized membrane protein YedE/YeeE